MAIVNPRSEAGDFLLRWFLPMALVDKEARRRLLLVLGGARSGKSSFAVELAKKTGKRVGYVATAKITHTNPSCGTDCGCDAELVERIETHRRSRPAHWETFEIGEDPIAIVQEAARSMEVVVVDCFTLLISHLMPASGLVEGVSDALSGQREATLCASVKTIIDALAEIPRPVIVVSNTVGEGIVPAYASGRLFRDVAGWANQRLAEQADEVFLIVAGIPLAIKNLQTRAWEALEGAELL